MKENKKPDNPAAFPLQYEEYNSTGLLVNRQEFGMTLRDYFAAKAMQSLLTADGTVHFETRAKEAYEVADAMLKQREL